MRQAKCKLTFILLQLISSISIEKALYIIINSNTISTKYIMAKWHKQNNFIVL